MSRHADTVNLWLSSLAEAAGIESLELNDQGVCAFQFGDRVTLCLELPDDSDVLHLYSPICPVPGFGQTLLFRRLLEWNLLGLGTRGASFGIDRNTNQVLLSVSLLMADTSVDRFLNVIGNFAETCERFADELNVPPESDDLEAELSDRKTVILP